MTESFYWTEYTVIYCQQIQNLEMLMRTYLAQGFEPIGSLVVSDGFFYREVAKRKHTE